MRLSIIIPVYNVQYYLDRCLNSIIQVMGKDIEIILINDGSTDNSKQICEKFIEIDNRIKLFNQENHGLSHARNRGLDLAKGKYITFIDSDDWINPNGLMELLEMIEENNLEVIYGEYTFVKGKNEKKVTKKYCKDICTGLELLNLNLDRDCVPVEVVTNIYKKDFLNKYNIKFVEGLLHEDTLFSLICYLYAKKAKCVPVNYYYYYMREGSIMRTISLENYLSKLYISNELQQMKQEFQISSLAWDTIIFSLYFDTVRNGNIKSKELYLGINNNQRLTLRSKIKKVLLYFIINKADEIDYQNLVKRYLHKE